MRLLLHLASGAKQEHQVRWMRAHTFPHPTEEYKLLFECESETGVRGTAWPEDNFYLTFPAHSTFHWEISPPPTEAGAPSSWLLLPCEGDRWHLKAPVDRFPDFLAEAGLCGAIRSLDRNTGEISLEMEGYLPGAESRDNAIVWADRELETNITPAIADFLEECEPLFSCCAPPD